MAIIRRHPTLFGSVGFCLVVAFVLTWSLSRHGPAVTASAASSIVEGPTVQPMSPQAESEVETLRKAAALDDTSLELLNLGNSQAVAVLSAVRAWYESNAAALRSQGSAIADARNKLLLSQADASNGRSSEQDPNTLNSALTNCEATYQASLNQLRQNALAGLTNPQKSLADLIFQRKETPAPYCALPLTGEQDAVLQKARQRYYQVIASPVNADVRASAAQEFSAAATTAIGATNCQQLAAIAEYVGPASIQIQAANEAVFPPPPVTSPTPE